MTTDAEAAPERSADASDRGVGGDERRTEAAIAGMREGAERIKRREVAEAVRTLEARDDLTDGQREAVEAMADAVVDRLLAVPAGGLRRAAADGDWDTVDAALRLFGPADGTGDGTNGSRAPEVAGDAD